MIKGLLLRPRERRLALIAGVVIGSWGVVSVVVQPLWDRARDLQLHVDTQTEKLDALSRLFAQRPRVDQEYHALAGYLQTVTADDTRAMFLRDLETLSRTSKLKLNLKPRPLRTDERVSRFEVEMDVEGGQQDLLAFLDALLRMPQLIAVEQLRISSVPTKHDLLRANLVIQKLTILR